MIAIPNMEMPETCDMCPIEGCEYINGKFTCPLIEIVRCGECKHFHYDMPYVIQGIPVLGHEVCDFWGDGCKTSENGFCSYAERRPDEHTDKRD